MCDQIFDRPSAIDPSACLFYLVDPNSQKLAGIKSINPLISKVNKEEEKNQDYKKQMQKLLKNMKSRPHGENMSKLRNEHE